MLKCRLSNSADEKHTAHARVRRPKRCAVGAPGKPTASRRLVRAGTQTRGPASTPGGRPASASPRSCACLLFCPPRPTTQLVSAWLLIAIPLIVLNWTQRSIPMLGPVGLISPCSPKMGFESCSPKCLRPTTRAPRALSPHLVNSWAPPARMSRHADSESMGVLGCCRCPRAGSTCPRVLPAPHYPGAC